MIRRLLFQTSEFRAHSCHGSNQTRLGLIKFWAPIPAVIAAGILSTYYFGITGTFGLSRVEFTRWGGQLLQLFHVHAEEWGYLKLSIWKRSLLTRIDGMMILSYVWRPLCRSAVANNVNCACHAAVSALCRPSLAALSLVLARVWQWAVTRSVLLPVFLSSRCMLVCHRHCHWFMVWRALTLLPIFRIPVKMQKACCLTADAKPWIRRGVVFVSGLVFSVCWAGRCSRR